jgi:exosortase/archaeosortase family protein
MLWRCVVFALTFAILQLSWQGLRETALGRVLVEQVTVGSAVALVNTFTPSVQARADGPTVRAGSGGLNIVNGCDGTETLFLLAAAFVVAPLPWRRRLGGFLLGLPVVFVVNELRILALFYANRDDAALFDLLHATVTPIAVVLLVAGYFYAWLFGHTRISPTR